MERTGLALVLAGASTLAWGAGASAPHDDLAQEANDPTAALMSVQIADWYGVDYHELDGIDSNQVVARVAMPFKIGEQQHILRVTAPFITDSPTPAIDNGLSDMTAFDMATFNQSWGRWGVGGVALMPTGGAGSGAEKWGLGPAFGFVANGDGFKWGAFSQNIFTVAGDDQRADVDVSNLQPILSYKLGNGWTVGNSEMQLTYDWNQDKWTSLPLGANVSKLVRLGRLPVQFRLEYQHDFADDIGNVANEVRFTVKFIMPSLLM